MWADAQVRRWKAAGMAEGGPGGSLEGRAGCTAGAWIVFFTPGPWFRVGPSGGACKPGRGVPWSWGQTQLAPERAPGTAVEVPWRHPRLLGAGELSSGGQGRGGAPLRTPAAPRPHLVPPPAPQAFQPCTWAEAVTCRLCILSSRHMELTGHCRSGVPRVWRSCPPAFLPLLGPHLMGLSCQSLFGIC